MTGTATSPVRQAALVHDALFAGAGVRLADRVLDVGCGTGEATRIAARIAARGHVVGVDVSAPLLRTARERTASEKLRNVVYVEADAEVHPFPRAGFDVILSGGGVTSFADHSAAFGRLARALLPGGRLAFVCPRVGAVPALRDPARIRATLRRYANVVVSPLALGPADLWLVTALRERQP
ncbi:methyltransferase domain-containing protein [Streptomyces sp. NPDC047081]|uniref:class I SAM-dependent methyltransferase n=1 Tax=Streptomyces sp. NPDC047081 TaxID=3154706 RepID=UPI0033E661A0